MSADETADELRARLHRRAEASAQHGYRMTIDPKEWVVIDALLARDEVDEIARENLERIALMAEAADRLEHLDAVLAEIVREADHYLDPVTRHQFAPSVTLERIRSLALATFHDLANDAPSDTHTKDGG